MVMNIQKLLTHLAGNLFLKKKKKERTKKKNEGSLQFAISISVTSQPPAFGVLARRSLASLCHHDSLSLSLSVCDSASVSLCSTAPLHSTAASILL
ncbi:hypothetical protein RchiOBHm_Chr5g0044181 [Rosa chinensis]|uniref:Uncharacterized protein n=1 Tax=Rosa chinensis TaxID=74649 RepID=A0A2P6QDJ8_ROSCH|nr:hypothetical protein RchiOBHm_Chr5g0044181 [Rosa chinensis]